MAKKFSMIQGWAWFYAANFFIVVLAGHIPGLTDEKGRLCGFYSVTWIIDGGHLLAGLLAATAAWHSARWSIYYFRFIAVPFGLDALCSLFFSRDITETGSAFYKKLGPMDLSFHNLLANLPHIILASVALWIGYGLAKKSKGDR